MSVLPTELAKLDGFFSGMEKSHQCGVGEIRRSVMIPINAQQLDYFVMAVWGTIFSFLLIKSLNLFVWYQPNQLMLSNA